MFEGQMLFEKELSWLAFNERVLQEAEDVSVPLIERIRFLGIYSANLDEFFRVRFADIRRHAILESAQEIKSDKWVDLLQEVTSKVNALTLRFKKVADKVFAALAKKGIHTLFNDPTNSEFNRHLHQDQLLWLEQYFDNRILRHITPIIIHSKTQLANCIDDDGIYFLVALNQEDTAQFCLVEIPREDTDRFIVVPSKSDTKAQHIVMLDDVVQYFLDKLFKGLFDYDFIDAYSFKLTRDAEYNLTDGIDESLLDQMSKGIKQRLKADTVRLVHDRKMPKYMISYLKKYLKIRELESIAPGVRYRHFKDFLSFPNLGDSTLVNPSMPALDAVNFTTKDSVFEAIAQQDILLYYPYHKFCHFTEFVRQSSYDPMVKHIKINIYRVAKHSRIIQSLIEAVKNGKRVTVVVELRARFDEQANIEWAKTMKDAGIDVEFGIESLKVHSKLCLVSRMEDDKLVRYVHIGTGNFHEKNARVYTDFALFTCHKDIGQEVENVFEFVAHSYKRFRFNHLIVSPLTSRRRLYQLIDNEILHAKSRKHASITLKLNNLVDAGLINKLRTAAHKNVEVNLIIRGMCALIPKYKNGKPDIRIISIVDQFLEHPRVMIFGNGGERSVFISSADWMERNIDHRVEVACPIYDPALKQQIIDLIEIQLADNVKARIIDDKQSNQYVTQDASHKVRSQVDIYHYLKDAENKRLATLQPSVAK